MCGIVYLGHSGFCVTTSDHALYFDRIGSGWPDPPARSITFVSHAHADHFSPEVLRWRREGLAELIVGEGVDAPGLCLHPGGEAEVDGVRVRAFGSTDEGVSFLAEADGVSVFHAGDFNFWHWRAESTAAEVREAEEAFTAVLDTLRGIPVDIAFFPVDPRMGGDCWEGALRYAEAVRPRLLIPMHFWDRPETALRFAGLPMPEGVTVRALTVPGDRCIWSRREE